MKAAMTVVRFRAHYDGRVLVPEEPVDLPIGESLEVALVSTLPEPVPPDPGKQQAAIERLKARPIGGLAIPDDALRRESLYEERA